LAKFKRQLLYIYLWLVGRCVLWNLDYCTSGPVTGKNVLPHDLMGSACPCYNSYYQPKVA